MQFAELLIDALFHEGSLDRAGNVTGSAYVLELLSHVRQVPLRLLPIHLGLGEQRVQLGNLAIGRFEFTFFVDEVFA